MGGEARAVDAAASGNGRLRQRRHLDPPTEPLLPFEPLHQLLNPLRQGVAEVVESIAKPSHFVFRRFVVGLEMSGPLSYFGYLPGRFLTDLGILRDVLPKRPSEPCSDYREDRDDAPEGFLGHIYSG
jgi:hypothetical protein